MQVKQNKSRKPDLLRATSSLCLISIRTAAARAPVKFGKQEPSKNHEIAHAETHADSDDENLHYAGESGSDGVQDVKDQIAGYCQNNVG